MVVQETMPCTHIRIKDRLVTSRRGRGLGTFQEIVLSPEIGQQVNHRAARVPERALRSTQSEASSSSSEWRPGRVESSSSSSCDASVAYFSLKSLVACPTGSPL